MWTRGRITEMYEMYIGELCAIFSNEFFVKIVDKHK